MRSTQQTSLQFNIKESIRFFRGQGVQEILMIELNPDVEIYEDNQTVFIQGSLLLAGEYIPSNISMTEEKSLREISGVRSVEQILEREDGVNEILHSFPVNVSIPLERIDSVKDVYLQVNSFDYEMSDQDQMFIIADLTIGGLAKERVEELFEEDEDDEEEIMVSDSENTYVLDREAHYLEESEQAVEIQEHAKAETFEEEKQEAFYIPVQHVEVEKEENEQREVSVVYEEAIEDERVEEIVAEVDTETNVDVEKDVDIPSLQAFQIEVKKEVQAQPVDLHRFTTPSLPNMGVYSSFFEKQKSISEKMIEPKEEVDTNDRDQKESTSVLASLFQNSSPEKEYSKLKMYFVQKGDSLHDIALRYSISVTSLQRVNEIEDDNVDEGQLLYIPVYQ